MSHTGIAWGSAPLLPPNNPEVYGFDLSTIFWWKNEAKWDLNVLKSWVNIGYKVGKIALKLFKQLTRLIFTLKGVLEALKIL